MTRITWRVRIGHRHAVLCGLTLVMLAGCGIGCGPAWADEGPWAIYVMRPDGSQLRGVVRAEGFAAHGSPRWSHDDRRLVFDAASADGERHRFFVVDVDGGNLKELGSDAVPDWSPDDQQLIFCKYRSGGAQAGTWVQNLDGQGLNWLTAGVCARWSPDGGSILYLDQAESRLLSTDLASGEERTVFDKPYERIEPGFEWSPDGKRLALIGVRQQAGRELLIVEGDSSRVRFAPTGRLQGAVAWSPDGKRLAFSVDDRLHILDVDGDAAPTMVPGQMGRGVDPAWSHDGRWLALASDRAWDGRVQTARRPAWKLVETLRHPKGSIVYGLSFTPDGQKLVMGGDPENEGLQVLDLESGDTKFLGGQGISIAMFPDSRRVATSWLDPKIQIVGLDDGDVLKEFDHGATVRAIAVSPDGTRLLSGGLDKQYRVWDVETGQQISTFDKHDAIPTRAAFSPDGKQVFSAAQDKKLRIWDASSGQQLREIEHPDVIWGLAVSPDGRQFLTGTGGSLVRSVTLHVISGSDDNVVRLWDAQSGKLLHELKGHTHVAYTIDFSPDGRLAVSGGWDGSVRLWDLETGKQLQSVEGIQGSALRVQFSPDGRQVAVGGGVARLTSAIQEYPDEQLRLFKLVDEPQATPAKAE